MKEVDINEIINSACKTNLDKIQETKAEIRYEIYLQLFLQNFHLRKYFTI